MADSLANSLEDLVARVRRGAEQLAAARPRGAAVLIPLVERPEGPCVVLEVRSRELSAQPGEVCLPGGAIECGETACEAAVRETSEELLVDENAIGVVADLGDTAGPGSHPLRAFVGTLGSYEGTFSSDEVERTFEVSLAWLLEHEPLVAEVPLAPSFPEDMPWELVPGGTAYPWAWPHWRIPFWKSPYEGEPAIWGATARVLERFLAAVRDGQTA